MRAQNLQDTAGVSVPKNGAQDLGREAGQAEPHRRHRPEQTVLYRTVQENWRSFVEQLESEWEGTGGLPHFVSEEIEAFLRCGILAHGLSGCRAAAAAGATGERTRAW